MNPFQDQTNLQTIWFVLKKFETCGAIEAELLNSAFEGIKNVEELAIALQKEWDLFVKTI